MQLLLPLLAQQKNLKNKYVQPDDLKIYFNPNPQNFSTFSSSKISIHCLDQFPYFEQGSCLVFGVYETIDTLHKIHDIKTFLYQFNYDNISSKIVDLGNLKLSSNFKDNQHAINEIIVYAYLIKCKVIILSENIDIGYELYKAYGKLEEFINLAEISNKISLSQDLNDNWIFKIINEQPCYLFNYTNIGYQSYYLRKDQAEFIEKIFFEYYRLGETKNNLEEIEPTIRNNDLFMLDLSAVKYADVWNEFSGPNGFLGDEICTIAKYIGNNNRTKCLALSNIKGNLSLQSAELSAQIVWYAIFGMQSADYELPNTNNYFIKYIVYSEDLGQNIVFYKNNKNGKWWMEVPFNENFNIDRFNKFNVIPCSYNDYQFACNSEIPDRWWKTFQKFYL
jgi:hypothetical protein